MNPYNLYRNNNAIAERYDLVGCVLNHGRKRKVKKAEHKALRRLLKAELSKL